MESEYESLAHMFYSCNLSGSMQSIRVSLANGQSVLIEGDALPSFLSDLKKVHNTERFKYQRAYQQRLRQQKPEQVRAQTTKDVAEVKLRYKNDPEYREKCKERTKAVYAAGKEARDALKALKMAEMAAVSEKTYDSLLVFEKPAPEKISEL